MGGIAEVLHNLGYRVSGSDISESAVTERLRKLGVAIQIGHDEAHVAGADAVIVSTAVPADNPEIRWARAQQVPIVPRAEMLAELMRFRHGIAVAGTHGKTTTTSLIATLLGEGGLDPTVVVGGRLNSVNANARLGTGSYIVAEADESDASFLYLKPVMAVVTNVDTDHMDTYGGDFQQLRATFLSFLHHLPFYGLAVMCVDDPQVRQLLPEIARPVLTYGLGADADIYAGHIRYQQTWTRFTVSLQGQPRWLEVGLNLPGRHNVLNALAAIAVARELGVNEDAVCRGLETFQGISRRFQVFGEVKFGDRAVLVVDDYAHHPREIAATLQAARAAWPSRRLTVAFQPHRYSRMRDLIEDFANVLSQVEVLLLLEVYAAGEAPIPGADGRALCRAIRARGCSDPVFAERVSDAPAVLEGLLRDGDVLLLLGAGDIGSLAATLVAPPVVSKPLSSGSGSAGCNREGL